MCMECSGHGEGKVERGGRDGRAVSRRGFLGGLGAVAAVGALSVAASSPGRAAGARLAVPGEPLPRGRTLRGQPALMYHLEQRREKTSWRSYGGLCTEQDVAAEVGRIKSELAKLVGDAEFPLEILPLARIRNEAEAKTVASHSAKAGNSVSSSVRRLHSTN